MREAVDRVGGSSQKLRGADEGASGAIGGADLKWDKANEWLSAVDRERKRIKSDIRGLEIGRRNEYKVGDLWTPARQGGPRETNRGSCHKSRGQQL
jgi:hypothetical protein